MIRVRRPLNWAFVIAAAFFILGALRVTYLTLEDSYAGVVWRRLQLENIGKKDKELSEKNESGFVFLACGDPQGGYGTFRKIRRKMAKDGEAVFVAVVGDIVKHGSKYRHLVLRDELSDYRLPIVFAPGDHDYDENGSLYHFGGVWGNWTGVPIRFLNAVFIIVRASDPGGFSDEAMEYLERQLEELAAVETKIVLVHEPPFDPRFSPGGENAKHFFHYGKEKTEIFHALMKKHGVAAVVSGHLHGYFHYEKDGVKYLTTGGAGAKFIEYNPFDTNFFHYLRITVSPKGVSHEVIKIDSPERKGWHFEGIRYLLRLNVYLISNFPEFIIGTFAFFALAVIILSRLAWSYVRPLFISPIPGIFATVFSAVISSMVFVSLYLIFLARL
ncbi:MAG: hypothetical protein E3J72_11030 [Planctomycetota bacterium]|nr:MAG: hypothetical protein E3J72_11030 [Planctomycetota bacterium]